MRKKCMSLLLAIMLILSGTVSVSYAAEKQATTGEEYGLLVQLGIVDSVEDSSALLTRSMAARIAVAVKLGGKLGNGLSYSGEIPDVAQTNADSAYIDYAVSSGFMDLKTNGNFEPNSSVSLNEMTQALVKALGYSGSATATKGEASQILKGIKIQSAAQLKLSETFEMVLNALDVNPMVRKGSGEKYEMSDKTCIEEIFDVKRISGILTTSSSQGINADSYVEIGGKKLYAENLADYSKYLGYRVEGFYKTDAGDDTLVYVDPYRYGNELLKIYAADIESVDENQIKYRGSSNSTQTVKISGAKMFYNGIECDINQSLLMIGSGMITVVNGGTNHTALLVEEYEDYILRGYYDEKIYDVNDPSYCLDLSECDTYKIIIDGKEATTADLKENDVLCIYASPNKKELTIMVSRKTVTGKLSASGDDNITIIDEVGEEQYFVTRYFVENYKRQLGMTALFRLNVYGDVVSAKYSSDWEYGYFMKAWDDDSSAENAVCMKLLTAQGEIKTFALPQKVKVNGSTVKSPTTEGRNKFTSALKTMASSTQANGKDITLVEKNQFVRQIIKYKTDFEGRISEILTAEVGDVAVDGKLVISEVNKKDMIYKNRGCFWCENGATFFTPEDTKVFYVPIELDNKQDESGNIIGTLSNDKSYVAGDISVLSDGSNYSVYTYDLTKSGKADCMVIVNNSGDTSGSFKGGKSDMVAVKEMSQAVNADGEVVYKLTGWKNGAEQSWMLESEFEFYKNPAGQPVLPDKGDLIQIYTDNTGVVTQLLIRVDISEGALGYNQAGTGRGSNVGYWWEEFGEDFGKIVALDEFGLKMYSSAKTNLITSYSRGTNPRLYIYDMNEKTYMQTSDISFVKTIEDFGEAEAAYAYITTNYGRTTGIYIYVK